MAPTSAYRRWRRPPRPIGRPKIVWAASPGRGRPAAPRPSPSPSWRSVTRSWPERVPALMAVAGDAKKDAGLRCNVIGSLGRMKAAAATEQMRKLLVDENEAVQVQVQAAIALYRMTGEKVKQFPAGYNAD